MDLYVFNPDNDLALANYDPNYRPPASAAKMGQDLTPLPGWLAHDGDCLLFSETVKWEQPVLYPDLKACFLPELTAEFAKDKKRWVNLQRQVVRKNSQTVGKYGLPDSQKTCTGERLGTEGSDFFKLRNPVTAVLYEGGLVQLDGVVPWGWNPALVRRLANAGVAPALLPSAECLRDIRTVSHRSLAIRVLRQVREEASADLKPLLCGESREVSDEGVLRTLIGHTPDGLLLKAPLSGSGRGLIRAGNAYVHPVSGWCRGTLGVQGSVIVEPLYNKVCDFAMEFYADGKGAVAFKGYSLFETNVHGSYTGNLLMTDRQIAAAIGRYGFQEQHLQEVCRLLSEALGHEAAGRYRGPLGVDMMVCRAPDGGYKLHPCVEVNARFTMGLFSRLFYDRYASAGVTGTFRIRFSKQPGELQEYAAGQQHQNPLVMKGGRIVSGYLPLNPVDENTRFLAEVCLGG